MNDEGIEARIRQWLSEAGWTVQANDARETRFNVVAYGQNGYGVTIYRPEARHGETTIATKMTVSDDLLDRLLALPQTDADTLAFMITADVLRLGADFVGAQPYQQELVFMATVYDEELARPVLFQRMALVGRAMALAVNHIRRAAPAPSAM